LDHPVFLTKEIYKSDLRIFQLNRKDEKFTNIRFPNRQIYPIHFGQKRFINRKFLQYCLSNTINAKVT